MWGLNNFAMLYEVTTLWGHWSKVRWSGEQNVSNKYSICLFVCRHSKSFALKTKKSDAVFKKIPRNKSKTHSTFAYRHVKSRWTSEKTPQRFSASGCVALPLRSHAKNELWHHNGSNKFLDKKFLFVPVQK